MWLIIICLLYVLGAFEIIFNCEQVIIITKGIYIGASWIIFIHFAFSIEIFVRDDHQNEEIYQDLDPLRMEYQRIPQKPLRSTLFRNTAFEYQGVTAF